MSGPKPMASLTSGLLARKGDARPAMRPAYVPKTVVANLPTSLQRHSPDRIERTEYSANDRGAVAQFPAIAPAPTTPVAADTTPVMAQQERLARALAAPAATPPAAAHPAPEPASKPAKAKAAFTLRLDPERHLRLRLARALSQRSAQQIVCDALDAYLDRLPGLQEVAAQAIKRQD